MRPAIILCGATLVLGAASCGGKSPTGASPPDGASGDGPIDAATSDVAAPNDGHADRGDAPAIDTPTSLVTAQYRACVAYFRAQCNLQSVCGGGTEVADPCPTLTDHCPNIEFAPGSLRTPESLLACADAWRTFPCQMYSMGKLPACAGIPGSLPIGAPCSATIQCASRSCGKGSDTQHPKCGACAALPAPGGCGDGGACQADELCISAACQKVVTGVALGQTCDATHLCAAPNVCRAAVAGGTTCQPEPKLGEPCSGIIFCADGSLCTAAKKCEVPPSEGQPCKRDAVFNRSMCADADVCDEMAAGGPTCVVRPGAGGACMPAPGADLEQGSCAKGLYCACAQGGTTCTCIQRRQEGETCGAANDLCVPGTSCVRGKCEAVMLGTMAALCGP